MKIKILGGGCKNCQILAQNAEQAAKEKNIDYEIEKVTNMAEIMSFGVMSTPALVIEDEVKFSGRVADVEEIKNILEN